MDRDGTVLPDGQHQLLVYKAEDVARLKDPSAYLQLPYSCKQVNPLTPAVSMSVLNANSATTVTGASSFQRGRESVTVSFYLCSTKLTQNGLIKFYSLSSFCFVMYTSSFFFFFRAANLLSLLKWKYHPERITDTLNLVMRLRGEELVKFLQDVLDSLFAMFSTEDGNSTPHSGLVFEVLVRISIEKET